MSRTAVNLFVDQIDRQTNRLSVLVEEMLDISRISLGKLKTVEAIVDLAELASGVVQALADLLQQSGCSVILQSKGPAFVRVDWLRMNQVIENLLTNAMKYGGGEPISIGIESDAQEVRLSVHDLGMGIAEEDHERIFQRFERAISSRNISGMGLGLYICKQIVESHHGRIKVCSELGKGSTFTVILPAAESSAAENPEPEDKAPGTHGKGRHPDGSQAVP